MSQKIEKYSSVFYMLHSKLIELLFVKLNLPAVEEVVVKKGA